MKINLIKEDFINAEFCSINNCPLSKALERLKYKYYLVTTNTVDISNKTYWLPDKYNIYAIEKLINLANSGQNIEYSLELREK